MEEILQQTVEVAAKIIYHYLWMGKLCIGLVVGFGISDLHPKAPVPRCIVFRIIGRSIIHQAARKIFLVIGVL